MPSSAETLRASRTVSGALEEEMASWARLRLAMEMSSEAMKPDGVRFVAAEDAASSASLRSRRALALSLFSSCWVRVSVVRWMPGTYYSSLYFWCRGRHWFRSSHSLRRRGRSSLHHVTLIKKVCERQSLVEVGRDEAEGVAKM
jgi:hypothetical protein